MTRRSFKKSMSKEWLITLACDEERHLEEVMKRICGYHTSINVPSESLRCTVVHHGSQPVLSVWLNTHGLSETGQMLMPLRLRKYLAELAATYHFHAEAVSEKRHAA